MPIPTTTRDGITVVSPAGLIDTRNAQVFEATIVQAFGGGARAFAIDFTRVDLITSAGIRVLVMMTHRLQRASGGMVLFGLGDRVRTVFEIGGLLQQFRIVASEQQAFETLSKPKEAVAAARPRQSRLTGLVFDVVCTDALHEAGGRPGAAPPAMSALTSAVADALDRYTPQATASRVDTESS